MSKNSKKVAKNTFFYFTMDFKEEERKKGKNYGTNQLLFDAAGEEWKLVSPQIRAKYEAKAKEEKKKLNIPEMKYTSQGVSFAAIEAQQREEKELIERERDDIRRMLYLPRENILDLDIFLMDVNIFCVAKGDYIICEIALLRFNIREGICANYHKKINPGTLPVGYASDTKLACDELGYEMPSSVDVTDYLQLMAVIVDFLSRGKSGGSIRPPIFTMPDKVPAVMSFIQQLCCKTREDDRTFRVYQMDTLFYYLINAIATKSEDGFPKESLALNQLRKDSFDYTPGLACEFHEESDKAIHCCKSRVKRQALTILDHCCPAAGIQMLPGKHLPGHYDVDTIMTLKEKNIQRMPSLAHDQMSRSAGSSVAGAWGPRQKDAAVPGGSQASRHAPPGIRRPKIDLSKKHELEFTEANFPTIMGPGKGRGSLNSSMNKLQIGDKKV